MTSYISFEQAMTELGQLKAQWASANVPPTQAEMRAQLDDLVAKVSHFLPGATSTLLYSGSFKINGTEVFGWQIAQNIAGPSSRSAAGVGIAELCLNSAFTLR